MARSISARMPASLLQRSSMEDLLSILFEVEQEEQ
jgi:hypothetical protein